MQTLSNFAQMEDESEHLDIEYGETKVDASMNEVNVTNERNGRMDGRPNTLLKRYA